MTKRLSCKLLCCVTSWLPSAWTAQDPNGTRGRKDRRPAIRGPAQPCAAATGAERPLPGSTPGRRRQRWRVRGRPEATASPRGRQPPSSLPPGQPPPQAAGAPQTPRGSWPAPRPPRANQLLSLARGAYETRNRLTFRSANRYMPPRPPDEEFGSLFPEYRKQAFLITVPAWSARLFFLSKC